MTSQILNGKKIAFNERENIKSIIDTLLLKGKRAPKLTVLHVGYDPTSEIYIKKKQQDCNEVGIISELVLIKETVSTENLIEIIQKYNEDALTDAILIQLPLPKTISRQLILESITPEKDVDAFHPFNQGRLSQCSQGIRPCTPLGIMRLLQETNISLSGLKAVIVGSSNIVGRPMALQLLEALCTVTICHINTINLKYEINQADLIVSAVGKPFLIKGDWIKPNAIVIDAGISRLNTGEIVGDVEFNTARKRASWITPVPGGVGPMTVAMLLKNTLQAYLDRNKLDTNLNLLSKLKKP